MHNATSSHTIFREIRRKEASYGWANNNATNCIWHTISSTKIVKTVSSTKLPYNKKQVGIKISVGLACTDEDNCSKFIDLYNLADKRNMNAKNNGKNCVESN